jgi:hypothetical protein
MSKAKIRLSQKELDLASNAARVLTKNVISKISIGYWEACSRNNKST